MNKIISVVKYLIFLLVVVIISDIVLFRHILNLGLPRHYEEDNLRRKPFPYVMFSGTPHVITHNAFGFRGKNFTEADKNDFKIAFFGGSTGYNGNPTIAEIIEKNLQQQLKKEVFVANFSVVSSNHRQHLHGIVKYLSKFQPDLVIFYGGFNEIDMPTRKDPRPGYPYNYFFRAELSSLKKLLLKYSAIAGVIELKTGRLSGLSNLKKLTKVNSREWNIAIAENYFETLKLANQITNSFYSAKLGKANFLAFYQPYQISQERVYVNKMIRSKAAVTDYLYDVSTTYDPLGHSIYKDLVHVNQEAKILMGNKIANIIFEKIKKK